MLEEKLLNTKSQRIATIAVLSAICARGCSIASWFPSMSSPINVRPTPGIFILSTITYPPSSTNFSRAQRIAFILTHFRSYYD
jgi:hypothetical protein